MTRPFTLLIKPAGPDCNIGCDYCFYSCKADYFGRGVHRMTPEIQTRLAQSYMQTGFEHPGFAWQGGEPTLMGLDFYKRLIDLQKQYQQPGQTVANSLQTNGILLDDQWCHFLAENQFLLGISLDGPRQYHNVYRHTRSGTGTFDAVMEGINACRRNKTEFNILVLLNNVNVEHPDELFDFFVEEGINFLQFIPCVERSAQTGQADAFSITPQQYGTFLCRFFDRWLKHDIHKLSIRLFDSVLHSILNLPATECTVARQCSDYIVVEHNGDAFCCDFYVQPDAKLGNIMETPIEQLADSPIKRAFSRRKAEIANKCLVCRYLDFCRGGCPKDRAVLSGSHKAPSYYCEGYKMFFDHALGQLQAIAGRIRQGSA